MHGLALVLWHAVYLAHNERNERDLRAPYQLCLCSTLENAFAFQPYFKTAAREDKVIRNTALQSSGLRAARPHVINH